MKTPMRLFLLSLVMLSTMAVPYLRADDAKSGEDRLRQSLRDTMLQLRQAQTDLANLQATQAAQADDEKALKDQVALLTKHSAEDRSAAEKTIEALKTKQASEAAEITRLNGVLAEWKAAGEKLNAAIRASETEKAKAVADATMLDRKVEDLKAKNAELYRLGKEILKRYQNFTLGDQFQAREPFIGTTRVYLENLIQDTDDQLQAQKAKP